ncbi:hypothetical protein [Streptomyces fuscichromogenes]|uniref:Uncharacterized protein n=1 Tax=Streptomyces fuscichromogenes TaxID=1324013 RepID=A0A917X927_9ACTN|nr:hypothetical protein [Streptomyces fuscichromogenes]GGM95454.1 hypothetical protein GCM10011578_014870 [Streptomyces fuscichromogenes]
MEELTRECPAIADGVAATVSTGCQEPFHVARGMATPDRLLDLALARPERGGRRNRAASTATSRRTATSRKTATEAATATSAVTGTAAGVRP